MCVLRVELSLVDRKDPTTQCNNRHSRRESQLALPVRDYDDYGPEVKQNCSERKRLLHGILGLPKKKKNQPFLTQTTARIIPR